MKLYYIDGCCYPYISDEPVDFRCETCGDDHRTEFEIDTENPEWIDYIEVSDLKITFNLLKKCNDISCNEIETMKGKILDYIKEEILDI
ncbi:hypothetical protein [Fusobacterium ulcerans]